MTAAVTHIERSALIKGGLLIEAGKATLCAEFKADRFTGETEGRFVMRGPSGVHTLLIEATDAQRLNAHWQAFAAHALNHIEIDEPAPRIKLTKGWGFGGQTV